MAKKFKLIAGSFRIGIDDAKTGKVSIRAKPKPGQNIIAAVGPLAGMDLAEEFPGKFVLYEGPAEAINEPGSQPQAAAQRRENAGGDAPALQAGVQVVSDKDLDGMSEDQLKTYAEDREINLKGAKTKEAMLKAIRSGNR